MATPSEKLAKALEALKKLQDKRGIAIIRSKNLSRTHKELLLSKGFIREVIKGWYISVRPDEKKGDTTSYYTSYWHFVSVYFNSRFEKDWCLSPEQSLSIHSGNLSVPQQLLVRSPKAQNNVTKLLHGTSIFDLRSSMPDKNERLEKEGLQLFSIPAGLIFCSPDFFTSKSTDARICLSAIKDSSEILPLLLDGGHSVKAGRLAGAFRNIGRDKIAGELISTLKSAGYDVREDDPFMEKVPVFLNSREPSPYVNRIKLMWQQMRQTVIDNFLPEPGLIKKKERYLKHIEEIYASDAYHSLSIEGYLVTRELIERVKSGMWDPDGDMADNDQRNVMAARGYWQAFQKVKESINMILDGKNPGEIVDNHHGSWYRELFSPGVAAGILKASDLAGYRNDQVYIKGSLHTPPNKEAVRDAMPVFFDMLKEEKNPAVRIVLGHFIFVYIHPYMDGNGRIARFLMNCMMASGGFQWTIIPVEKRNEYLDALEKASVDNDISDFTKFLGGLVKTTNPGQHD